LTLKALFSSKLRVKVLSHYFFHPAESFYVRQLAADVKEPAGSVARELAHLKEAGILSSCDVGNQKHYRLEEANPILDDLRNIFLKTSGASLELKRALEKLEGVDIAFIYGSCAEGKAHAASDIDLMVIGEIADRVLAPAVARVERHLKRDVNYTLYSRREAEKQMGKKGEFVHEVLHGPRILLIGERDDRLLGAS